MDILLLIVVLILYAVDMLGGNNGVGRINENLEKIKPKMRKIKIPEKLKYYIPQYCSQSWVTPPPIKLELYILTVVLAVCNYIFHGHHIFLGTCQRCLYFQLISSKFLEIYGCRYKMSFL